MVDELQPEMQWSQTLWVFPRVGSRATRLPLVVQVLFPALGNTVTEQHSE